MRTARRSDTTPLRRAAIALAAVLSAATCVVASAPAEALSRDRITVSRGKPVEADFPPIPAAFWQSTNAVTPLPAGCGNDEGVSDAEDPPPFAAMCDRIPLRIVVPTDLDVRDDFIVTVALSWPDSAGTAAGASGTANDMDLYVYDNRQIAQREDPESTTFTQQTSSASLENPESVILGDPRLVDYTLIIVNASGVNEGYTIKAELKVLKADKIFELLEEGRKPQKAIAETPPEDLTDGSAYVPPGFEDLIAVVPGFEVDFSDFGSAPLEQALRAPLGAGDAASIGLSKPKPVSGLTLLLWLGLAPAVLSAVGFVVLRRRGTIRFGDS